MAKRKKKYLKVSFVVDVTDIDDGFESVYVTGELSDTDLADTIVDGKVNFEPASEETTVNTPLGTLVVKASTDSNNPGFYIDLRRSGCDCDAPVAMVEATSDETDQDGKPTLITRVWDNVNEEEYRTRVIHSGIEEYFREED